MRKSKTLNKIFDNYAANNPSAMYDAQGNTIRKHDKCFLIKMLKPIVVTATTAAIVFGALYIPQVFMPDVRAGDLIATANISGWSQLQNYLEQHKGDDFDKDGMTNWDEMQLGADPFFADTDRDGLLDGRDPKPMQPGKELENAVMTQGTTRKDPYSMNGVVLWPDDKYSWLHGAVIEVQDGFQFTNFKGWAKFPSGTYAFQHKDGAHTLLPYREDTNTWHITEDCTVVLRETIPEDTYCVSLVGHSFYIRNATIGNVFDTLLPQKGWLTCKKMWLDDTFVDTQNITYAPYRKVGNINGNAYYRNYSKSLDSLANVYQTIKNGSPMLVSLQSEKKGECILEVYGFTQAGDLIVANPQIKSNAGVLTIDARCERIINEDGTIGTLGWFEFYGCGYNSYEGAYITFVAMPDSTKEGA